MKYPDNCNTLEKKNELLKRIASDCRDFLRRGDRWWVPFKESTLYELLTTGHLDKLEYDYLRKNQKDWEEHYRRHVFSPDRIIQDKFETAYNYRDW